MSERTASARGGARAATDGRQSFTERAKAAVANAATEHRANATPEAGSRRTSLTERPSERPPGPRKAAAGRAPRRARLRLTRIDPWSVMKTSFLLSIAFGVVTFVAVFMIWSVLGAAGVWESINSAVASVVEGDGNTSTFDITNYVGMSRVLGFTLLVAVLDVILITAIATLTAFLYNLSAALLGGVEVTLAEDQH